jgi:squalene synthase HpnC
VDEGNHNLTSVVDPPVGLPRADVVMAQSGTENFPVASRLLPSAVRADLLRIYGFARLADDIGDEATGDRLVLLDWLERELTLAAAGTAAHPMLRDVGVTIRAHHLPLEPFERLIDANRQDQRVHRYETFDDLVAYCHLSADPVGELVLRVTESLTSDRLRWSDDVCTGLQLVEHLQDVGEDAALGRVYLPGEDLRRFGCAGDAVHGASADPPLRAVILFEADRAERLLAAGRPLSRSLPGRLGLGVAAFAAGGLAVIDALRAAGGDTLGVRCRPARSQVVRRWLEIVRPARTKNT